MTTPPIARRGLSLRETAHLINRSVPWLYKAANRAALEKAGFPKPLGIPGVLTWDRDAVNAWLDAQMPAAIRPKPPTTAAADQWAADLDKRAAAIAQNGEAA